MGKQAKSAYTNYLLVFLICGFALGAAIGAIASAYISSVPAILPITVSGMLGLVIGSLCSFFQSVRQ